MTSTERVESYIVGPGFELPDLTAVPDVSWVHTEETEVDATYYDTADARLAAAGLTVHHETGTDPGCWFVTSSGLRERIMLGTGQSAGVGVPTKVAETLGSHLGRTRATAAMRLTSHRQTSWLHDAEGDVAGVITLDRVCGLVLRAPARRRIWDALTIAFTPGFGGDLAQEVRRLVVLRGAGTCSGPDQAERLLGVRVPARPNRLAGLVHDHLQPRLDRLVLDEICWRDGRAPTADAVAAAREVLAVGRVLADVFEPDRLRALTADLLGLAVVLDRIEDADLRRLSLRSATGGGAGPGSSRDHVRSRLEAAGRSARADLGAWMTGERHIRLVHALDDWRAELPLTDRGSRQRKRDLRRYLDRAATELDWRLSSTEVGKEDHSLDRAAVRAATVAALSQPALGRDARVLHSQALEVHDRQTDAMLDTITRDLEDELTAPHGRLRSRTPGRRNPCVRPVLVAVPRQF